MNEINIKFPLHKFQTLIHRYVRDSLHDNGTPVLICIHDVKEYWAVLDSHTREKIKGEVKFFIKEYHHLRNDEFFKKDLAAWSELADWINENRSSPSTTATTAKPIVPVLPVINPKQRKK
ncbi:hypothetical protein [Haemophilus influenzae]|uniref:Uncharacterized protein n=1 Tax=Haemophilus influenzae F3047 TaxID=935897 RepID=A0AAV2U547_HAEIF|nr:hypothetical protein [Haemophilus influenzae]MDO7266124.1 hypothetical protein [Haemophilus influenzae]MDO7274334.1 hypothetical protein [Haemophilus influenzae]QEQ58444.1 hypothetical protein F1541_04370 [Haemophilus influenzae biotype aegyptius]QEQ61715.1 hypothetical protein F1539_04680 [Haemophilus influenzae biotype aegyptius]QEQ64476.1 hypothetical protein F1538_09775 [Haemophilus influenzae biotype aegyptius]